MENRTLEMTSASGTKYQFIEIIIFGTFVCAYAWYSNEWNKLTVTFKTFKDAQEWVKQLNTKHEEQKNASKIERTMPASAYYSITGYYGD